MYGQLVGVRLYNPGLKTQGVVLLCSLCSAQSQCINSIMLSVIIHVNQLRVTTILNRYYNIVNQI